MVFYFTTKRSEAPLQGGFSANFSSATNGPTGNPNYSTVTGNRTFYRVLTASTGEAFDVRVTTSQVGTTFNNSALGTGNMHMFVKIPGTTGWMDATQNFVEGSIQDGNGALNPTATNTSTVRYLTFGTASVANNDHIMFKLIASSSWTGELNSIEFDPNVSTATNAAALSTIDVDSTGTNANSLLVAQTLLLDILMLPDLVWAQCLQLIQMQHILQAVTEKLYLILFLQWKEM